jgi:uncharacterized protein (DUF1810 family)
VTAQDPYNLERFVWAQQPVIQQVFDELRVGHKRSHWMWYVFPQLRGLGRSAMAQEYAISGLPEAQAYFGHPLLGERLRQCTGLVLQVQGRTLRDILGYPDDLKFCSSMTLFSLAAKNEPLFADALEKYCAGEPDEGTLTLLQRTMKP